MLNRAFSGIAAVADASSSQSRTDVICLALATCLVLTGLQWASLKARDPKSVELFGDVVNYLDPSLPPSAAQEAKWVWESLKSSTKCGSLLVVYDGERVLQAGVGPKGLTLDSATVELGDICKAVMKSGRGNYMANMALFPGRKEFEPTLPINSQGVLVQPIGERGVVIAATGTVRGFSQVDQAWISVLSDKLDNTLEALA